MRTYRPARNSASKKCDAEFQSDVTRGVNLFVRLIVARAEILAIVDRIGVETVTEAFGRRLGEALAQDKSEAKRRALLSDARRAAYCEALALSLIEPRGRS